MNPVPQLHRNISLYPWFRVASDGFAWIPVFFLYMIQTLPLAQVIQLSAIYYIAVFLLEVPSGYFSDRIGRRTTLLLAAAALVVSYCCFIIGADFWWFAAGQTFLAAGIAMQSGTDTALHYDSLKALGRETEYPHLEAKAEQWGLTMLAFATFAGGALGMIDLRLAYLFSLISALVMATLVWQFVEPLHESSDTEPPQSFTAVVWSCMLRLRHPLLGWIFLVSITLYAMAHIVFEFYQPYLTLLQLPFLNGSVSEFAPLLSGVLIAISMFGGAIGAKLSMVSLARLGLIGLLAVSMVIQLGIVAGMAIAVSPVIALLICTRNFPMALVHAPVRAAIAPHISRRQRATYLSIQGLSERLFFAGLLLLLAAGLERAVVVDEPVLSGILGLSLWIGIAISVGLFLFWGKIRQVIDDDAG